MFFFSKTRQEYERFELRQADLAETPLIQFDRWFQQALDAELPEPNAMALATVDSRGQPTARMVLLKAYDEDGIVFYTNYQSDKGQQLAQNERASVLFFWQELQRQARIEGVAKPLSHTENQAYFESRPIEARISACASAQSRLVTNRAVLEERVQKVRAQYGEHPPCPVYWGGYRLRPSRVEFWQGRESRLHDRFVYLADEKNGWVTQRLAP